MSNYYRAPLSAAYGPSAVLSAGATPTLPTSFLLDDGGPWPLIIDSELYSGLLAGVAAGLATVSGTLLASASELLTTFAPNTLPMTGFFNAHIFEIARNNAAAIVLGSTAVQHTADLAVTAGHKHDSAASRLAWRQIAQWSFVNNGSPAFPPFGTPPDEVFDSIVLNSAVTVTMAWGRFWGQPADMVRIIPRVRVSNDNSALNTTDFLLEFYNPATMALLASSIITFDTSVLRNREWIDGTSIDLSAGIIDPDQASRIPLLVRVYGTQSAANEPVALHELVMGVDP